MSLKNKIRDFLFGEPCQHYSREFCFYDIHTGRGGWYVRGTVGCTDCGWTGGVAINLPESLDLDKMDKDEYWQECRDGVHSKRDEAFKKRYRRIRNDQNN